jgi:hypothetical protein
MRMAKRFGLVCAAGLALAAACSDTPPSAPIAKSSSAVTTVTTPTINNFVVYAANNVTLGASDHSVGGNIGVATSNGTSPQLSVGSQDTLDAHWTLYAPAISVGNLAQVGAVDTSSLTNSGGQVGAQSGYPSPMPPLPTIFPATPGTTNVTVAAGQQQTLSPGPYGTLTDDGIVFLNPGTYSFASITLGNNALLQAQPGGSTSLLVAGALSTGTQAQILPVGQPANALTISVSATDGTNGSPPAVSVGTGSQVIGLLAAPNGSVSFANNVQATGAFAGLNFSAGSNVTVNFQSGFANAVPTISTFVAYAELSMTLGTGDHLIGGDVGVAATGASTVGTQMTIGSQDQLDQTHTVYGPSVSLGSQAIVGDIDTNALTNNGGQFGTQEPYPSGTMPLLPLALAGAAGTTNITVSQGQQQTLTPGPYGTLIDNGILFLQPGPYSFTSVTLGNNAQIQAQTGGATSIQISGNLATGAFAQILPLGQPAAQLSISVAGSDGANGQPPAVSLGANTQIVALLNAPRGTLSFGNNVQATGAFGGFFLTAGSNVTLLYQSGFPAASQQATGLQQLSGYITASMAAAPLVGPVPPGQSLNVGLALPVQAPAGQPTLEELAEAVSDPTNPSYLNFITPAQFVSTYSPTVADYNALTQFATSSGLSVINSYGNRTLLDVSGTAAQLEAMAFTNLNVYLRSDGTQFFAPDREPSLNLSVPVLRIAGLDNYGRLTTAQATTGTVIPGTLAGQNFRTAYAPCVGTNGVELNGQGQTIALFEQGGYNIADVEEYFNTFGEATPTITNVTFYATGLIAFEVPPLTYINQPEPPMDIELATSMAGGAQLVVYQIPIATIDDPLLGSLNFVDAAMNSMAYPPTGVPLALQNSSSTTGLLDSSTSQTFHEMAVQGQTFFEGTGDNGAYITEQDPPGFGSAPYVTQVGGTILDSFGGGRPQEVGWPESGGGYLSSYFRSQIGKFGPIAPPPGVSIPTYQQSFVNSANGASATYRNVPDVSIVAQSVEEIYTTSSGAGIAINSGGTSASTPLWAGFMALVNQQAQLLGVTSKGFGFINKALYGIAGTSLYTSCFNDIGGSAETSPGGSNPPIGGLPGPPEDPYKPAPAGGFTAVAGYDLVTGLGTPTCTLLDQLASGHPTVPFCSGGTVCDDGSCCDTSGTDCVPGSCGVIPSCVPGGGCCPGLVTAQGQCCASGQTICDGLCCSGGCTPSGTCCEAGQAICNGQCCSGACTSNGTCCGSSADICGSVCCTGVCANASTSTCCSNSQAVCNGECCNGSCTPSGACCETSKGLTLCGSACCAAGVGCLDESSSTCGAGVVPTLELIDSQGTVIYNSNDTAPDGGTVLDYVGQYETVNVVGLGFDPNTVVYWSNGTETVNPLGSSTVGTNGVTSAFQLPTTNLGLQMIIGFEIAVDGSATQASTTYDVLPGR